MPRLDQALVDWGYARSRAQAVELIRSGFVERKEGDAWRPAAKAALQVRAQDRDDFRVLRNDLTKYVSRGGAKLEGALRHLGLDVTGLLAVDIGLSTGGFADCLLQAGAVKVVGLDVGHGQLHGKLKNDPRLVSLEGLNARHLDPALLAPALGGARVDLVVIDVSFISLTEVLTLAGQVLRPGGSLLALVKPQFEVGAGNLGKGGLVKDKALYQNVREKVVAAAAARSFTVSDYFPCSLEGGDGNQEFFLFARKDNQE